MYTGSVRERAGAQLKSLVHKFGRWYCEGVCKREFQAQDFRRVNERPIEFRFVFEQLTRLQPTTVLDVGSGTTALPHLMRNCGFLVTATDNVSDYWPKGMFNRHYYVINDDITNSRLTEEFDVITCISVLEHIARSGEAVQSMFRLLKPGGHLVLTFPYNEHEYVEDVYKLPGAGYGWDNPYICQVYSRRQIEGWKDANGAVGVEQEYWQCFSGRLWTFGQQVRPPRRVSKEDSHQLTCLLFRKVTEHPA
jgi:SAM-dependent methyltransferase